MTLNKKMYRTLVIMIALTLGYGSMIFADPIVGDIPSSASENRTIQNETTIYTSSCDIEQNLAFYDGSDVYLRVAQPKTVVNYVFDKSITYVRVYGGNLFAGNLRFPYISNFIPSTTTDTESTTILSVVAEGSTFAGQTSVARSDVAGQVVTKNMLRTLLLSSAGSNINYYYRWASDNSLHNGSMTAIINPNFTEKTTCTNYYVGRCGDGVVDNGAGGGIDTATEGFLERHPLSIIPSEQCDDGNLIDGDGCSNTCQIDTPQEPICNSVVATPFTGDETTQYDITCYGTNASSYQLTITNSVGVTVYTNTYNGTENFHTWYSLGALPAGNNTVSCTVIGGDGTTPDDCTDTSIIVIPTVYIKPTCSLTAYDDNGDVINGTVPVGTEGTLQCLLTNAAVLSASPYMFNIALNGQTINTPTWQSSNIFSGILSSPGALNAVCTLQGYDGQTGSCSTSFNIGEQEPILNITKTIVPNPLNPSGLYGPGDEVTFRVDFSNIGSGAATNVRLRDLFPIALDHNIVGGSMVGIIPPYTNGVYFNGVNTVIEYSGFTLAPGASGYIIAKGSLKGYDRCDQTTNHAYIISDNAEQAEAHIMFNCATPDANLSITKTASTSAIHLGGTIGFTITITNNGDTINNLQINDIWPDQTCITPDTNVTSNMTLQTNGNFSWTLPGALPQGQTLTINLNGQVVNADACAAVGPFTNTAIYDYTLVGIQHTGQASAMFNILATPYANIDFQKTILQAGGSQGDIISYQITYTNNGTDALGGFVVSDYRPATLEFISSSWMPITVPNCTAGCTLTFQIPGILNAGESANLVLTGKIK